MLIKLLLFSSLVALGKASGFAKELFISYYHGVSPLTDNYVVSNTLTSAAYIGVYASIPLIVVPLYTKNQTEKNYISNALLTYLLASSALLTLTWLGFSFLGLGKFFNQPSTNLDQLVLFVLIAALTFVPSTISAFFNALHSVHGSTQWTYIVPIANNISFCIGIAIFSDASSFYLVLISGLFSWTALSLASGITFSIKHWRGFWSDFRQSLPSFRSLTLAAPTIAFAYIDQLLVTAATLAAGALSLNGASIFNYSIKLLVLFVSVISLFMTTFALTRMARFSAAGDLKSLETFSGVIFELTVRIFLPLAVLLSCLSPYLIRFVFERGAFTVENSAHVSQSMEIVALSLPFLAIKELLIRFMFATFRQAHCILAVGISILSFLLSLYGCIRFNISHAASISYLIASVSSALFLTIIFFRYTSFNNPLRLIASISPAIGLSAVIYILSLISKKLYPLDPNTLVVALLSCYLAAIAPYLYSRILVLKNSF